MPETYIPVALRKLVVTRANSNCEYCLLPSAFSAHSFCIDHIVPTSKGGKTIQSNLAHSCSSCNGSKHNKITAIDPFSKNEITLFNPRKDIWKEHFDWDKTYSFIVGISPCGRATVESLKMNTDNIQNMRKALRFYGVFSPEM